MRAAALAAVQALVGAAAGGPVGRLGSSGPDAVAGRLELCPEEGVGAEAALGEVADLLAEGVRPSHPLSAAHLQCPTLIASAAAELLVGATNQSLDSWEQAPAATPLEDRLVRWLAATVAGAPDGSGVLTAGGTASNLLGLALARDRAGRLSGVEVRRDGLPADARGWRIVASEAAHDSVRRSAAVLGLGEGAVTAVATDNAGALCPPALDRALARMATEGLRPIALVATAGTTDLGAIDPIDAIADRASACGTWLHVDAAVGSALALSARLAPLLAGIARADSVTADMHKLWWQPIAASALLVRDPAALRAVNHNSDYLNRPGDEADGVLNLVSRSLDTSRRFDALKILVGLRAVGRRRLAAMVEHLVDLASRAGELVSRHPELELLAPPSTVTVCFRWRPPSAVAGLDLDLANAAAQRRLMADGKALIGRTRVRGAVALKLTLTNPLAGEDDVAALLDLAAGAAARAAAPAAARA